MVATDPAEISQLMLEKIRNGSNTTGIQQKLCRMESDNLAARLSTDRKKKAFWINIYNAYVQLLLDEHPDLHDNRRAFFQSERICIADTSLSLDTIAHGMLRRSRVKWGLGYITNPLPDELEQQLRVDEPDPRVHFALNRGASSCPPIRIYDPEQLNEQLDRATHTYLEQEAEYKADIDLIRLPRIFLWFRGDFGGKEGIIDLLHEFGLTPRDDDIRLRHKSYDWRPEPGKFIETEREK
jgi:hypothetical protein